MGRYPGWVTHFGWQDPLKFMGHTQPLSGLSHKVQCKVARRPSPRQRHHLHPASSHQTSYPSPTSSRFTLPLLRIQGSAKEGTLLSAPLQSHLAGLQTLSLTGSPARDKVFLLSLQGAPRHPLQRDSGGGGQTGGRLVTALPQARPSWVPTTCQLFLVLSCF